MCVDCAEKAYAVQRSADASVTLFHFRWSTEIAERTEAKSTRISVGTAKYPKMYSSNSDPYGQKLLFLYCVFKDWLNAGIVLHLLSQQNSIQKMSRFTPLIDLAPDAEDRAFLGAFRRSASEICLISARSLAMQLQALPSASGLHPATASERCE